MIVSICTDVALMREHIAVWRASGKRIALVPTMGALHPGHLALISAAKEVADRIVVSIFVNPKQFAPSEDFTTYPRHLEADGAAIEDAGGDLVYAPDLEAMYPPDFATSIHVEGPATVGLEDRFRPTHFQGVTTVVAKLLMQVQPDAAIFGEKDYQQLRVIERMVVDLDIPVEIYAVPIMREESGLALSSRNVFLDNEQRVRAPAIQRALHVCAEAIRTGQAIDESLDAARRMIEDAGFAIDYVEARRAEDLAPLEEGHAKSGRILAAVRAGDIRLIDNVAIDGSL